MITSHLNENNLIVSSDLDSPRRSNLLTTATAPLYLVLSLLIKPPRSAWMMLGGMKGIGFVFLLLWATSICQASTVIYSDTFARDGALDGSTPETGPKGEKWWAGADVATTSAAGKEATLSRMGVLPFVPEQGKVYTLSAKINPIKGKMGSFGFFTKIKDINSNWFDCGEAWGWMFEGTSGSTNYFSGPIVEKSQDAGIVGAGTGEFSDYSIVLDTTAPNWFFEYYRGDKLLGRMDCETNPDIQYIAIGVLTTDDTAKFKDFTLVSEP